MQGNIWKAASAGSRYVDNRLPEALLHTFHSHSHFCLCISKLTHNCFSSLKLQFRDIAYVLEKKEILLRISQWLQIWQREWQPHCQCHKIWNWQVCQEPKSLSSSFLYVIPVVIIWEKFRRGRYWQCQKEKNSVLIWVGFPPSWWNSMNSSKCLFIHTVFITHVQYYIFTMCNA